MINLTTRHLSARRARWKEANRTERQEAPIMVRMVQRCRSWRKRKRRAQSNKMETNRPIISEAWEKAKMGVVKKGKGARDRDQSARAIGRK